MHGHFFLDLPWQSRLTIFCLFEWSKLDNRVAMVFFVVDKIQVFKWTFCKKKYVALLTLQQSMVINWILDILDSYPEIADGIVVKTVCVRSTKSCCETSFTIGVRNCSSYYSFYLTNVPTCNQSYCFGM